jgi:hypothetical protein
LAYINPIKELLPGGNTYIYLWSYLIIYRKGNSRKYCLMEGKGLDKFLSNRVAETRSAVLDPKAAQASKTASVKAIDIL